MHSDLDSFEWAETDVGDQLSRSRGTQEESSLVLGSILLADHGGIQVLEVFVEAIFAGALHRVTNEGWTPTSEDTSKPFTSVDLAPRLQVALIQIRVDLSSAFDEIEGSHGGVGGTLLMVSRSISAVA